MVVGYHHFRKPPHREMKLKKNNEKPIFPPQVPMVFILDDELTMMMPGEEDAGGPLCGEMGR